MYPVTTAEPHMVVSEGVRAAAERRQRRRLSAGVGAELSVRDVVAQEILRATNLGLGRGILHRVQPTLMNGVIGVHAGHDLICVATPTAMPFVLDDDLNPGQISNPLDDVGRAVRRAEEHSRHFEAAHTGDEKASEKLESAIEPGTISVAIGVGLIVGSGD